MRCDLCDGDYEEATISESYKHRGRTVVVENIPARVCFRCGDTLVQEETLQRIQLLLDQEAQGAAPLYRYPERVV